MAFHIVIPARYASTRLPGKPLLAIAGKPMLQHVYERARQSDAEQVIIATDDERIKIAAEDFSARVCMTSTSHTSGTERLAEVVETFKFNDDDIIVNLQGDEPLMPAACLNQVADILQANPQAKVSTLCVPIDTAHELFDPHVVKVVRDSNDLALYFSRAPIPWHRDEYISNQDTLPSDGTPYYRHVGLYAYHAGFIKQYVEASACHLEQAEALEQLRVLWHGEKIIVAEAVEVPAAGIDTQEDFARVEKMLVAEN